MWATEIKYKKEDEEKLKEITSNISKKDNSFNYAFDEDRSMLIVICTSYPQAKKMGGWFYYKVSPRLKNQLFWNIVKR